MKSTFRNQRGSVLELTLLPNNKIEGYFTTAVASKECQQVVGQKQAIVGYWTGNALTFSVVYEQCGSIYSVVGNFNKEQSCIDVIGVINHQSFDPMGKDCGVRSLVHDIFNGFD